MFRMNFPRRFTSRPDFRLRVLPLEIGLSIIADNTPRFLRFSSHASSFFSNAAPARLLSPLRLANRATPDGVERRKRGGGALSQCQFLGILIIGAADATPGFLSS